jgi:polysaccharide export outer membrane protein
MGRNKFIIISSIAGLMIILTTSCVSYNKVRYFTDIDKIEGPVANPREQKLIMPFDNLYIKVLSIDEQQNRLFDANQGNAGLQVMISYLVDKDGNIDFPFVGSVNLAGLTINQASIKIQTALSEYVPKTSIIVRFIENKITIMGQVEHQGIFPFTQDKLNIYEALALGGGISLHGNRRNVVLIRQEGDKIVFRKINLADSRIASKENFFILPNDVLVVEPMKSIGWIYNTAIFSTVLTTITTIIALSVAYYSIKR